MFLTCCRRSSKEYPLDSQNASFKKNPQNESQQSSGIQSTESNTSASGSSNLSNGIKTNTEDIPGRERTTSASSVNTIGSFYSIKSVKSTPASDGDFYSVYSNDSFKSA